MERTARIYVAGHTGLVGSALMRLLAREGYQQIITRTSRELDLRSQQAVAAFWEKERPEYIFLAAARVGGIKANSTYPADFLYDNSMIALNVIHAAHQFQAKKLLFLGSSCIYPRMCQQPMQEDALLSGPLEETNEWYAIAKIVGLKLCQAMMRQYTAEQRTVCISAMPTNLYGIGDTFDAEQSHVIPALIMKFCKAVERGDTEVMLWGTGRALREFLYVDDLAEALLLLMRVYDGERWINVGTGIEHTIATVAHEIARLVGFSGKICFDTIHPDGTPRKVVDGTRIRALGWSPHISFSEGLEKTIRWYQQQRKGQHNDQASSIYFARERSLISSGNDRP